MFTKNLYLNFINYTFFFFPVALILGNLITNLNIVLIIFFGFLYLKKEIFEIKEKFSKFLIIFFLYLIFISFVKNFSFLNFKFLDVNNFLKSIFFLRYLFLFLIIAKLSEKKLLNLNYFYLGSILCSLIIGIDIIYQVINGKNIIGLEITQNRPSSFFGEESIAGGYLQRFSLFLVLSFFLFKKKFKNIKIFNLIIFFTIIFFLISILLSGNRMPFIIYIISIILFCIIQRKFFFLFSIMAIASIVFALFYSNNLRVKNNFSAFFFKTKEIILISPQLFMENKINKDLKASEYIFLFNGAYQIWLQNKFFGNGIKSFRKKCTFNETQICSSHPHNYNLEILVDVGLIGFLLFYIFFFKLFFYYFKNIIYNKNLFYNYKILPFFLVIFLEMFPLRSTGSFFSTNNASFIFIFLAILAGNKLIKKFK